MSEVTAATQQPARGNTPLPLEVGDSLTLTNKGGVYRDIPRYVVMAGDLMPPADKRGWRGIAGAQVGGFKFDLTDVPCLWKHQGFVLRGQITPLIKKPVQAFQAEEIVKKKAEEQAHLQSSSGEVKPLPAVHRWAYPWDSLMSITNEFWGRQGFREIEVLSGVAWESGIPQEIQAFYFKDWPAILAGNATLPFQVDEFSRTISARLNETADDTIRQVGEAFLASAEQFKVYATEVAQKARESVARGMNDGGYMATITPYQAHLAAQVGIDLTKLNTVQVNVGGSQPAAAAPAQKMSDTEFELEMRKTAAQEEANRLKAIELGLVDGGKAKDVEPAPATAGICSALKKDNTPCRGTRVNGTEFCSVHQTVPAAQEPE